MAHAKYANFRVSSSLGPFFGFCWQLGRLPREMAQHGNFGDTSMVVCSLSSWVGVSLHFFSSSFSISSACQVGHLDLEILLSHIFSSKFCDVFCSCRSLSSSANKSGCSGLGCHHPVILLQHLQEVVAQNVIAQENLSQKDEFLQLA